ncbi:MAG: hypothetical protein V1664_01175 [Candidatus Uhrbacteria bacterium]
MFQLPAIDIPLILILIPYGLIVGFLGLYSFFNLYQLIRFATFNFSSYLIFTIYLGGVVIIGAVTYFSLIAYDWTPVWNLNNFLQFDSLNKIEI